MKATSAGDLAIYSRDKAVALTNSMVYANGADGKYGIYGKEGVQASGSWVETSGPETLESAPSSIENSVLFNGKEGKVLGNAVIPADVTVAEGMKLTVPEGTSLTVPEGKTLTNHGVVTVSGEISRAGNVICDSHTYNWQSHSGNRLHLQRLCGGGGAGGAGKFTGRRLNLIERGVTMKNVKYGIDIIYQPQTIFFIKMFVDGFNK